MMKLVPTIPMVNTNITAISRSSLQEGTTITKIYPNKNNKKLCIITYNQMKRKNRKNPLNTLP